METGKDSRQGVLVDILVRRHSRNRARRNAGLSLEDDRRSLGFARLLRAARLSARLSRAELAEKACVAETEIVCLEHGFISPSQIQAGSLRALAGVLGGSIEGVLPALGTGASGPSLARRSCRSIMGLLARRIAGAIMLILGWVTSAWDPWQRPRAALFLTIAAICGALLIAALLVRELLVAQPLSVAAGLGALIGFVSSLLVFLVRVPVWEIWQLSRCRALYDRCLSEGNLLGARTCHEWMAVIKVRSRDDAKALAGVREFQAIARHGCSQRSEDELAKRLSRTKSATLRRELIGAFDVVAQGSRYQRLGSA